VDVLVENDVIGIDDEAHLGGCVGVLAADVEA
jgi:hypothetical protein